MNKEYIPTEKERTAYYWCVNNNVKVHVKPRSLKYTFVTEVNGIGSGSGKLYSKEDVSEIQWRYYLYLYEKLGNV